MMSERSIRRMVRATEPGRRPFCVRNFTDSGRTRTTGITVSAEQAPPAMNTDCQPNRGISRLDTGPPAALPTLKPAITMSTEVDRIRAGANSVTSAQVSGRSAPMKKQPANR